ncbi:MAG: tetratricopeptide repeat protein [Sphingomonadales bacterium]
MEFPTQSADRNADVHGSPVSRKARACGRLLTLPALAIALVASGMMAWSLTIPVATAQTQTTGGSFLSLANRLAAEGNHKAAIPLYRQAHDQDGSDIEPLLGLGTSLMALGQYSEALDVLLAAYERESGDREVLEALGTTYLVLGDKELAKNNLEAAMNRGGRTASLYASLGVTLAAMGDLDGAVDVFDDGLSIFDGDVDLVSNKGLTMAISGDVNRGLALLIEAAGSVDAVMEHRQNLALGYVLAGRNDKARRMASIDLEAVATNDTIAFFQQIAAMAGPRRIEALLYGIAEPRHDLEKPANLVPGPETADQRAAVERIVTEPAAPEPVETPTPTETSLPGVPPLMDPEGWAVQIAAYRSLEDLVKGWAILSEKYADIIGHLEPRRSEVDFGARGEYPDGMFFRLNAGPLEGFSEAREICDQMEAVGGECWIRPPEPEEGRLPKD